MNVTTLPHLYREVLNKAHRKSLPCLAQGLRDHYASYYNCSVKHYLFCITQNRFTAQTENKHFKWWVQMSSIVLFHNFAVLNCAQVLYRRLILYIIWRRLGNKSWSPCSSTKIKNILDAFSKSVAFTLISYISTIKMINSLPNLHFLQS